MTGLETTEKKGKGKGLTQGRKGWEDAAISRLLPLKHLRATEERDSPKRNDQGQNRP